MRHLKIILGMFLISFTTLSYAVPTSTPGGGKSESISEEIEELLADSSLIIEEEFTVTVFFKVAKDRSVKIRSVSSPNEEVNTVLKMKLQDQKLYAKGWFPEKLYELPVRVKPKKI